MNKKNILYLTYDGLTDPLGQSQILPYVKGLSKLGYRFTILSCEKPERHALLGSKIQQLCDEDNINWVSIPFRSNIPIFSKIVDRWQFKRTAIKLYHIHLFELVHCRSYISSEIGLHMKIHYGCKFIFDMRGFWADEKLESGHWKGIFFKLVYNQYKRKEKDFFKFSDSIISLTLAGKKEIVEGFHIQAEKITVIPTCVNLNNFKPYSYEVRKKIRREHGISESDLVILYSGSFGGNYNTQFIKDVVLLLSKHTNIKLVIISQTPKHEVMQILKKYEIPDAYVTSVNYTEVFNYLIAADVGIVNYKNDYSVIGRSPTKLGEYWACGLPCLAPNNSGDLIFLKEKYPEGIISLCGENENGIVNTIQNVNKNLLRSFAEDWYALEKGVAAYSEIYKKILTN